MNCIRSVYASETGYSFEIILVDNASSDGSVDAIKYSFLDVRIIENKENVGFGRANNQAAEIAAGRYLYILNSDTEIEKDVIEKVVSYGDLNQKAGVIGTKVVFPDGKLQKNFYKFPTFFSEFIFFTVGIIKSGNWFLFNLNKYRRYSADKPFEVDVISGCSMFVKQEVYKKVGLFNEAFFMYYEDGEFCYKVKKGGFKCIYLPEVFITHIHMGTSKKHIKDFKLLTSCFNCACIYFKCVKNRLYAFMFKILCVSVWLIELIVLGVFSIVRKDEKIIRKINMLRSLLMR
jgi:GT2 family glycosyltransferase